jgi:hypothetical protein
MPSRRPPDEFVTFAAGDPLKPLTPRSKKRNPIANPRLSGWADVLTGVHDSRSSDSGGRLSECYRYPKPTR